MTEKRFKEAISIQKVVDNQIGKRFKEIISVQKVIDTQTGKEYDCLMDDELLDLINDLAEENEQLKQHKDLIITQIKAFRDDCYENCDFDSVSTLNQLLKILDESMELFEWLKKESESMG